MRREIGIYVKESERKELHREPNYKRTRGPPETESRKEWRSRWFDGRDTEERMKGKKNMEKYEYQRNTIGRKTGRKRNELKILKERKMWKKEKII